MENSNVANGRDEANKESVVVVDIGKKYSRKQIRRLRRGEGKLMDKIEDLVSDMRKENSLGKDIQPVVIVVREKNRKYKFF